MVIFSLESPKPNGALLDRFLIMMEKQGVPVFICFNKEDLVSLDEAEHWKKIYRSCGYDVLLCSAGDGKGLDEIETRLTGRTTVVAGPSGVGKSTITNLMQTEICMETGEISRKLKRGKHTTRPDQALYHTHPFPVFPNRLYHVVHKTSKHAQRGCLKMQTFQTGVLRQPHSFFNLLFYNTHP